MKQKKLRLGLFIFIITLCILFKNGSIVALAEDEEEDTYVEIKAEVSDGIEIKEGDIFLLTYKIADETEAATIMVDAYSILDTKKKIHLPQHTYEIVGIEYKGDNASIIEYGVISMFNSRPESEYPGTIILAIGTERTEKLRHEWADTLCVNAINEHILVDENGNETTPDERYDEQIEQEKELANATTATELEMYSTDDMYSDDYGVEEQLPVSEEPKIEVYTTESDSTEENIKDDDNIGMKAIVLIISIIIIVAILVVIKVTPTKTKR